MATDTYLEVVSTAAVQPKTNRRLPIGIGLSVAAGMSLSLWVLAAMAVRSLFS